MNALKTSATGKPTKTKPKPRARRTKSEVQSSLTLTPAGDDTDPRTTLSTENISAKPTSDSSPADHSAAVIRPRSSSRRRAYIIKRPQSAPFFGRVTPRAFTADEPGDADHHNVPSLGNPADLGDFSPGGSHYPGVSSHQNSSKVSDSSPDAAGSSINAKSQNDADSSGKSSSLSPAINKNTQVGATTSKPLSVLCQYDQPLTIPPSAAPAIRYGETHLFLRKENSIDRREHLEVSVSETILIQSTKSRLERQIKTEPLDQTSKVSSFLGTEPIPDEPKDSDEAEVGVSHLYAQVMKPKPAAAEVSLDLDKSEYDDFIQSPAEISTARDEPGVKEEGKGLELYEDTPHDSRRSEELRRTSGSLDSSVDFIKGVRNEEKDVGYTRREYNTITTAGDGEGRARQSPAVRQSWSEEDGDIAIPPLRLGSLTGDESLSSDVVIPPLRLGSLTGEESLSSDATPISDGNSEKQEDSTTEIDYANFEVVPTNSEGTSMIVEDSKNDVFEDEGKAAPSHSSKPFAGNSRSYTNVSLEDMLPYPGTASLNSTPPPAATFANSRRGINNLKETYALPDKPKVNVGKNLEASPRQPISPTSHTPSKQSSPEPVDYKPVKKLSVEYTDPVRVHSSDILQAGGIAHEPHEAVSPVWSEDTDSEETHKVKKRQNNPLKRLFARKKGKYNPSLDLDASRSILPTLETEKEKVKKEKSSSPKLFKRKNKAKILLSESELSPSDENSSKQKKETKKKQKAKLKKENIIVIKSSGKSLSDSMPELAMEAPPSTDGRKAGSAVEERARANKDDGKTTEYKGKQDSAKVATNIRCDPKNITVLDDNENHFYTNVTLTAATAKDEITKSFDFVEKVVIDTEENKSAREKTENLNVSKDEEMDLIRVNSSSDRVVTAEGPDMSNIFNAVNDDSSNHDDCHGEDDVYANTPSPPSPVGATDRDIDVEPQYDRPPSKEIPQDFILQDTIDVTSVTPELFGDNQGGEPTPIDLPGSPASTPGLESRMNKYLYTEDALSTDEMLSDNVQYSQGSPHKSNDLKKQDDTVRFNQEEADGLDKPSSRRVLASIETTESDNELDEKLLDAAAAENPLRRPKYAMTRLQAHLSGKPVPKEPVLRESRYADKEDTSASLGDHKLPVPLLPLSKIQKRKEHRDRIERGEKSLEVASVLDTSGLDLSPRSDLSSDRTDNDDSTANFDDVIDLCDAVESIQDNSDDQEKPKYKNANSLGRSPSQLLIRADVHTASVEVDTTDKQLGEDTRNPLGGGDINNTQVTVLTGTKQGEGSARGDRNKAGDYDEGDRAFNNNGQVIDSTRQSTKNASLENWNPEETHQLHATDISEVSKGRADRGQGVKTDNAVSDIIGYRDHWPKKIQQIKPHTSSTINDTIQSQDSSHDFEMVNYGGFPHKTSYEDQEKSKPRLGATSFESIGKDSELTSDVEKHRPSEYSKKSSTSPQKLRCGGSNSETRRNTGMEDTSPCSINAFQCSNDKKEEAQAETDTTHAPTESNLQTKDKNGKGELSLTSVQNATDDEEECIEETIVPSVKQNVECATSKYTDRLDSLDRADTAPGQRPPAIKQKPPSWKMKAFLRKFDNVPSKKGPAGPPPKPQRHRTGARESINKDLLQDAMKELDDYMDNEFDDETDEDEKEVVTTKKSQPHREKHRPLASNSLTRSDGDQTLDKYQGKTEVIEEALFRSEAPKEKSAPIESIFAALEKRHLGIVVTNENFDDKDISRAKPESAENTEIARISSERADSLKCHSEECIPNDTMAVKNKHLETSKDVSVVSCMPVNTSSTGKVGEDIVGDISKFSDESAIYPQKVREPEFKIGGNKQKNAQPGKELGLQTNSPNSFNTSVHGPDTKVDKPIKGDDPTLKETERLLQSETFKQELDVKTHEFGLTKEDERTREAADPPLGVMRQDQLKLSAPPPIPVKKAKEFQGVPPLSTILSSHIEGEDNDLHVVDLGYEDVLDKLSDPEQTLDERPDSTTKAKQETEHKQSPSPGTKRFPFPWRKKSKDVLAKKIRPGHEEKQKSSSSTNRQDDQVLTNQSKSKPSPLEAQETEDMAKQNSSFTPVKPPKDKNSKQKKKKTQDKSGRSMKNSEEKQEKKKTKTKKGKSKLRSKARDQPVDLYHEIEEGAAAKEDAKTLKSSPVWKKDPASSSTSASSSPFSSSPLSADSSEESDYEPVNYVDGRELRGENCEEVKERVKSADSNGYEIPAENRPETKKTQTKKNSKNSNTGLDLHDNDTTNDKLSLTSVEAKGDHNSGDQSVSLAVSSECEPRAPRCESNNGDEEGEIEPYLTFQYPRYLDDGEIYVGNPVAVRPSLTGLSQTDTRCGLVVKGEALPPHSSKQNRGGQIDDLENDENGNQDERRTKPSVSISHQANSLNSTKELAKGKTLDSLEPSIIKSGPLGLNTKEESNPENNYYNDSPHCTTRAMEVKGASQEEGLSIHTQPSPMSSSPEDCARVVSPGGASSPELAVKSHISEALSRAFQDFDFGLDGSGPVSDAETSTASPQADKDRVSSIQWEWRDPPQSELVGVHGESKGNKDTPLGSSEDRGGQLKPLVNSSLEREMLLAGVGASVVLSEVRPPLATDAANDMYDSVQASVGTWGEAKTDLEREERKSLSSDGSSITVSPPSSPVSDKPHKERGRLGRVLAKRQAKSRDKSKDKLSSRDVKRAKSKDKLKGKESKERDKTKDKKGDTSRDDQKEEMDRSKDKLHKKESEEKDKWKWPWKRRGSKKETPATGNQSANESDKDSETSKDGAKPKTKKKKKKSVGSVSNIPIPSNSEIRQSENEGEAVPLNERNPSGLTTDFLLESGLSNRSDDHDYFNTFLDSSHCFQLPPDIESYIIAEKEVGVQEAIPGNHNPKVNEDHRSDKNNCGDSNESTSILQLEKSAENFVHGGSRDESSSDSLQVSDEDQGTIPEEKDLEQSPRIAKDTPWSMCQLPAFQSNCSLSSEDPWKDYSPLELGKTQNTAASGRSLDKPKQQLKREEEKDSGNLQDSGHFSGDGASKVPVSNIQEEIVHAVDHPTNLAATVSLPMMSNHGRESTEWKAGANERSSAGCGDVDLACESFSQTTPRPKAACRTVSQPIKTRSPPVPRVRKTVRRHRSELATSDESFLVEFNGLWNSGDRRASQADDSKDEVTPKTSELAGDPNLANSGFENISRDDKSSTLPPDLEDEDSEDPPPLWALSSPLELKPKTRRTSASVMDDGNPDFCFAKNIPPKPERKVNYPEDDLSSENRDQEVPDIYPRQKRPSDEGNESGVEYDKLPVRQKKTSSKMAVKSSAPPVPIKRPVEIRPVYTPVNRSPAQRLQSLERTEYAAPWEESIKALTPTLPPRQYRR